MKILIVGLGVQGKKRIKYLKKKHSYVTVDTKNSRAEYNNIRKVPLNKYDTVFVCTPDDQKNRIILFIRIIYKYGEYYILYIYDNSNNIIIIT